MLSGATSARVADEHIVRQAVIEMLSLRERAQTNEISEVLGLKPPRTRQLLAQMVADGLVVAHGERRGRYYCLPQAGDASR